MTLDLDDIERKAIACQAEIEHDGEWFVPNPGDLEWLMGSSVVTTGKTPRDKSPSYARVLVQANTNFPSESLLAYISSMSPPAVLAMIGRIRSLETELARASGIAKAHGEDAYAEDFMRVAQDRDDFDEQVNAKP